MPLDPTAQQILASAIAALVGALGLDRFFKRRARPGEIRKCSEEAIDALALALREGEEVMPADEEKAIEDWLLDEWQQRFREILDDEGLRITDTELRRARSRASARLVQRAIDAQSERNKEVARAAVAMSTPSALRRQLRTSDPPWVGPSNGELTRGSK